MLNQYPGIGLDIGSQKIKIARVNRKKKALLVEDYGWVSTPAGSVEAGNIIDPLRLGQAIGELAQKMHIKGQAVVSAVSGQQVYTRHLVMPKMKKNELKAAARYQAASFLPIAVEEAALDIFPWRNFEDEAGQKTELFFVAVRRQQVETLAKVCEIAGLKLVAVEIEPLAIYRVLKIPDSPRVSAILNIGASRAGFSVFKQHLLVFDRSLAWGCSAFYQGTGLSGDLDSIQLDANSAHGYPVRDIIGEVARALEYYEMQNQDEKADPVEKVYLCGGGARLPGLDVRLARGIGCEVEPAHHISKAILADDLTVQSERGLKHESLVAFGLAAKRIRAIPDFF